MKFSKLEFISIKDSLGHDLILNVNHITRIFKIRRETDGPVMTVIQMTDLEKPIETEHSFELISKLLTERTNK